MLNRIRTFTTTHQFFLLILFLFVVFRILAILLFRPGGFITDASDYDFYMVWGELTPQGYRAYDNLWTAYPPLFPLVMLPIFELSSQIPPWIEPRLFFHTLFGLTLLLFEVGNLILIYRLAIKLDHEYRFLPASSRPPTTVHEGTTERHYRLPITHNQLPTPLLSVLLYTLLFTPVYTLLGWFEPMPLFFMLLGLDLLLSRSRIGWLGSAIAAALGFLTKLTPILLLPIAVRWFGSKLSWKAAREEWFNRDSGGNLLRPIIYGILFLVVVLGVGYPVVRNNPELALSSFQIQGLRPPWQSLWALIDGFHGYGLVPIDMRNLVALETRTWESRIPWTLVSVAFVAIWLWLYTRPYDWKRVRTPISFAAISIIALFLYSKGWSPQFLVWVLAFLVLLLPTWRGMIIASVLALLNAIESHIFLVLLPTETWILWYTIGIRTLLLLLLAVEFLAQIWPNPKRAPAMQRVSVTLSWAVLALALAIIPISIPYGAQAYQDRRLAEHACPEIIAHLQAEAEWPNRQIVGEQVPVWRNFYPWIRHEYRFDVVDVYSPIDEPAEVVASRRLNELTADGEFWWLTESGIPTTASDGSSAAAFFTQPDVHIIESQAVGSCQLARVLRVATPSPIATLDADGQQITLHDVAWASEPIGKSSHLVIYWQAESTIQKSYTVFTQLIDKGNNLVAQKDNLPVEGLAPTDTWDPSKIIRDPYRLESDEPLSPGLYDLHIGMYQGEQRLPVTLPDGTVTDAVKIEVEIR